MGRRFYLSTVNITNNEEVIALLLAASLASEDLLLAKISAKEMGRFVSIDYIHLQGKTQTHDIVQLPEGPWALMRIGRNCIVTARTNSVPELVVTWVGGGRSLVPLDAPGTDVRFCQDSRFLMVAERLSNAGDYRTEVFDLAGKSIKRCSVANGKGYIVLGGQVFGSAYAGHNNLTFFSKTLAGQKANPTLKSKVIELAKSRQQFWLHDKFRTYGNSDIRPPINMYHADHNLAVNATGDFWFEKLMREYRDDGANSSAYYFAGHVLLGQNGMVGQWKFNRDTLHGLYFKSPTILRSLWTEKFLYGLKSLKWYQPGIYDLNLTTNKLSIVDLPKIDPTSLDSCTLINPN